MPAVKYIYREENGSWLGYFLDYPDYWTQGETLDDLKEQLRDLYSDLTDGQLSGIRKVDELIIS
jgi:predicted RNase H-like HicB family nuclease